MYYLSTFSNFPPKKKSLKEIGQGSLGTAGNIITIGYLGEQISKGKLRKNIKKLYPKVAIAGALGTLGYNLGKRILNRKKDFTSPRD